MADIDAIIPDKVRSTSAFNEQHRKSLENLEFITKVWYFVKNYFQEEIADSSKPIKDSSTPLDEIDIEDLYTKYKASQNHLFRQI